MAQQYDFLQLSVGRCDRIVSISQGETSVEASVDQLPDVIRALKAIHGEYQAEHGRQALTRLRTDLAGKPELTSVDGGPKGAA